MARFKIICFDMGEQEIIKEFDDVNEVIDDMQWRDPQSYFIGDERDKVGYTLKDFIRNFRDNKNELADEVTLMSKTKAVRVPNGYIVSFEYDRTKVNNIKTIEGRKYNVSEKTWFIPKEGIEQLKTLFNDLEIEEREVKDDEIEVALDGSGAFIHELNTITDENLREFASWCLDRLPKYFFEVGASSTGKYHPKFAQGKGGLVRHTRATVIIANNLFENHTMQNFSEEEKNIIRISLLLHDGAKYGVIKGNYTVSTHPLEIGNYLETLGNEFFKTTQWQTIKRCIASHMGEWDCDFKTKKKVLPRPETELEKFVHLCDYLASRKDIEIVFE